MFTSSTAYSNIIISDLPPPLATSHRHPPPNLPRAMLHAWVNIPRITVTRLVHLLQICIVAINANRRHIVISTLYRAAT